MRGFLLAGFALLCLLGVWVAFDPGLRAAGIQATGRLLEASIPRAELSADTPVTGILVLGGWPDRTRAAIDLHEQYPQAKLVLSGPYEVEIAMARAAVPPQSLIIDLRPQSTRQNAQFSKDLIHPEPGERWILVTSALHMPRALASFKAVGFPVLPWPVYDTSLSRPASTRAIRHEITGILYYLMRGWLHLL